MTAGAVAALFVVWAIAVVSPGPDLVVVVQRALAGRRHGLATACGVVAGITVWIVAAFAGLAAVLRVQPGLMTALQVVGGLLLATLGVLGVRGWWRARSTPENPLPSLRNRYADRGSESRGSVADSRSGERGTSGRHGRSGPERSGRPAEPGAGVRGDLLRGLATNLSNPKAVVFFGAVLAPFLTGDLGVVHAAGLVLGMVAVAIAWFSGLAVAASWPGVHARIGRWLPWIDLVASGLFVLVGATFVVTAL